MNYSMINSFSLVGNVARVNEVKEQANGKKFKYFTLAQNNNYKNKDGEEVKSSSFFDIKIYEKDFERFERILEVGKYAHIFGKINIHKDKDNKTVVTLIGIDCRALNKNKKLELFDYDWFEDDEHEIESEKELNEVC